LKVFEQLPFETIDDYCQATFCTPFKVCQNWRALLKRQIVKIIENTLKIDYSGRNFNIVEKGKKNCPWRVS
jgi:hypothetical protein